jgi:hypothetical protein
MVIAPPTVKYGIKIISLTILPELPPKSKSLFDFFAAFFRLQPKRLSKGEKNSTINTYIL